MRKIILLISISCLQQYVHAQTPDWATGVAPILYNHCTSCHHDGGIAPFSLLTFDEAVLNGSTMKVDVQNKKMPPWPPDPNYTHMAHERILPDTNIATIVNWVNGGMPMGDPLAAPPVPVYSTGGTIPGTPDLILRIPTYTSTASTGDIYQCFSIPSGLLADKYITAFEAVPGNPACVHHVLVYADTSGVCAHLDSTSPGPGYPDFGGVGSSSATLIGAWVPGSPPMVYPNGFGVKIWHNSDVVLQIHYPAGTTGMQDSTEVHFFFASTPGTRDVYITPVLNHETTGIIDTALYIAANTTKTFYERFPSPVDFSLIGIAPHMHLIGKHIKSYGILPSVDTDRFINIPKWDFHWQGFYTLPKIKHVPAGTMLRAEAYYDNTSSNPENPSSPPQDVSAGENTTDEMMIVFLVYSAYQAGDENIIIDSNVALSTPQQFADYYHGQQLLDVCPNPAITDILVKCHFDDGDVGSVDLTDMQGRIVKHFMTEQHINKGYNVFKYSVSDIAEGTYMLTMKTHQQVLTKKIVVIH